MSQLNLWQFLQWQHFDLFFSFFLFDPRDYNQKLSCFFFTLKHSNFNIKSYLRIDKACDSKWKGEITNTDSVQGKKK